MPDEAKVMSDATKLVIKKIIVISGMLVFGTATVVFQKIIFSISEPGHPSHVFDKPWFQTEVMFIGMLGCLAVYELMRLWSHYKQKRKQEEREPLISKEASSVQEEASSHQDKMPLWKQYVFVIPPAVCDLLATASMNIGLVWIPASVWQMLRGSMVIFTAIFTKFFLKKPMFLYRWVGVGIVVFALCVVAVSSLMKPCTTEYTLSSVLFYRAAPGTPMTSLNYWLPVTASGDEGSSELAPTTTTEEVIGILLVIFAQVIQATQIVIESHLMEKVSLNPVLIVGLEGLWGGLICSVCLLIVQFLPAEPPISEDTIDSFVLIGEVPILAFYIVAYGSAILCYNMFGMYVTQVTSAVVRTILEGLRTACIWITDLFIHYLITSDPKFGEEWTNWSFLQLCGFLFLLMGMFIYNGIVEIDGFYYPSTEENNFVQTCIDKKREVERQLQKEVNNAIKQAKHRDLTPQPMLLNIADHLKEQNIDIASILPPPRSAPKAPEDQ